MAWERVFVDVPASWENYLCDLGACYPNIPDGAAMNGSVSTGSSSFVGLNLVPDIDGAGMVQVNVWDVAIPDHKVLCTFYFSTGTVALMELKTAEVMMYPNPANDQLNMRIDATHTSSAMYMTMINITGSVVKEIYLGPLTYVTIDISDLPVGFYTAILTDGLSILSKKKLVIQH